MPGGNEKRENQNPVFNEDNDGGGAIDTDDEQSVDHDFGDTGDTGVNDDTGNDNDDDDDDDDGDAASMPPDVEIVNDMYKPMMPGDDGVEPAPAPGAADGAPPPPPQPQYQYASPDADGAPPPPPQPQYQFASPNADIPVAGGVTGDYDNLGPSDPMPAPAPAPAPPRASASGPAAMRARRKKASAGGSGDTVYMSDAPPAATSGPPLADPYNKPRKFSGNAGQCTCAWPFCPTPWRLGCLVERCTSCRWTEGILDTSTLMQSS